MQNVKEIAEYLEKTWFRPVGLFASMIATAVFLLPLLLSRGFSGFETLISVVAVDLVIVTAWLISQRPPKTPRGKIGFLVSISCSDDAQKKRIREDFVQPLRSLIKSGKTGPAFAFLEVPEHIASTVGDVECAHKLRSKCRAHFMIYGRVRLRTVNGEDAYFLDLDGAVSHAPIPDNVSDQLAQEFSELLPRKVNISLSSEMLGFQFTSEWADIVARYVIGLAAEVSGDLDYAEALFTEAKERLHGKDTKFLVYQRLKERIPIRFSEIHLARATRAYGKWALNKDGEGLVEADEHLAKIVLPDKQREPVEATQLKAILAFARNRDVNRSLELLKQIKQTGNATWHLNMAFLYGYKGELKTAVRHYRLASALDMDLNMIAEVEDFIEWVRQNEPEKSQLSYCLGFFNWKVKGDIQKALADFGQFLAAEPVSRFTTERALACKWKEQLELALKGSDDIDAPLLASVS